MKIVLFIIHIIYAHGSKVGRPWQRGGFVFDEGGVLFGGANNRHDCDLINLMNVGQVKTIRGVGNIVWPSQRAGLIPCGMFFRNEYFSCEFVLNNTVIFGGMF